MNEYWEQLRILGDFLETLSFLTTTILTLCIVKLYMVSKTSWPAIFLASI